MLSEYFVFNSHADLSRAVLRVMEEKGILLSKMSVSGLAAFMTGHESLCHLRNKRVVVVSTECLVPSLTQLEQLMNQS